MPIGKELLDELPSIVLGLATLFQSRRNAQHFGGGVAPATGGTSSGQPKKGFVDLVERIIGELGLGVRDEGQFPIKLGKLIPDERAVIEKLVNEHDKKMIDRLRLITINAPSAAGKVTKIKGKKEKKDAAGNITEPAELDREETTPGEDSGVLFLSSVAKLVAGKTIEEQVEILKKLNIAPSETGRLYQEAVKNMGKKIAVLLGLPENYDTGDVIAKLREKFGEIEIPDPTQPRPNDTAGFFVRFMRSITPGAFPNPERPKSELEAAVEAKLRPLKEKHAGNIALLKTFFKVGMITIIGVVLALWMGYRWLHNQSVDEIVNTPLSVETVHGEQPKQIERSKK